jgi:hypothetical protein
MKRAVSVPGRHLFTLAVEIWIILRPGSIGFEAWQRQWNHRRGETFCSLELRKRFRLRRKQMIYRAAAAIFAGILVSGAAAAQTAAPSAAKPETSCTTTGAATSGSGEEKTSNSMAVEKSAVLPDAGGSNSAAPTVQSGGKPLEVRSECPPDSKPKG